MLAESKIARSDYESFIWKCKREKKKENLGNFEFLKINKPATDYPSEA